MKQDRYGLTVKELIKEVDDYWLPDITNEDGSINEDQKQRAVDSIEENISDGSTGCVEGLILLSLLDGLNEKTLPSDLISVNVTCYPQWITVERAMNRRIEDVPMCALLDSFVIDDFVQSYCKKSISFDELIYRLVMLGRIPYKNYFRMAPKQRRELGTDVDLFHVW